MISREQVLAERRKWYSINSVQYNITQGLKRRELSFISPKTEEPRIIKRYLLGSSQGLLMAQMERFDFLKRLTNMYHSIATLRYMPMLSHRIGREKEEEYIQFRKDFVSYIDGYDLFFDLDGKENFPQCLKDVFVLKKLLDDHKVPYFVVNSSHKGFHFRVPSEFIDCPPDVEGVVALIDALRSVIYNIKGIYNLPTLDDSVTDEFRVAKVPYSYVCDGCICLPLSDEQLDRFTEDMVSFDKVYRGIKVFERGLLVRTHGLTETQLKENMLSFLNKFK